MTQNILICPILPDWGWEKHGLAPLTSQPGPGTSSASLDNISLLLGKQGYTAMRHRHFYLSLEAFLYLFVAGLFHQWSKCLGAKPHGTTKLPQWFSVKGDVSPHTLFLLTAALSTQKHSQGLHHSLQDQPFLPNECWDQCTEAEEDIQQYHTATSAPSVTAQHLKKGSTVLLTLQNSSLLYEAITIEQYILIFPNRAPEKLPGV